VTEILLLGRRAVREIFRYPEATIPTLFIPLFFLAVNIGQVSETFPPETPFLNGQGYVAFQLPVSLMFAVATAISGLALVTAAPRSSSAGSSPISSVASAAPRSSCWRGSRSARTSSPGSSGRC
jgi:hypothetical protein